MEEITIKIEKSSVFENFGKHCAQVFLCSEGFIFLCTLCDENFQGYHLFKNHIMSKHDIDQMKYALESDDGGTKIESVLDIESSEREEDFSLIDDIEFDAPEPNNCGDIEEYFASLHEKKNTPILKNLSDINRTDIKVVRKKTSKKLKQRYRCPKCQFVSHSYSNIMGHIQRHLGERRHFCEQCKKGFYTPTELKDHVRTHTGERPFLCSDCGQTFVTNSALWRHTKRCKNIRDKECPECGKRFFDLKHLREHLTVHSDERSYKCTKCDASFKLARTMQNHMKIHENKYEYCCKYCSASFNQQPGLISHVKYKHSGRLNTN